MAQKVAAGNWKMNGVAANLEEARLISTIENGETAVVLCPPSTLLSRLADSLSSSHVFVGAQDCHTSQNGAHTGDISAEMLTDAGASHVILGHSERRADHGETDEVVAQKVNSAWQNGLVAIICVGETESQRDAGQTLDVVTGQLAGSIPDGATPANTIIAYEPVWAIGTGRTATPDEIGAVHAAIRTHLADRFGQEVSNGISILYGGSVKATNAAEIFSVANVDGALVGGASLRAADFGPIVTALDNA